MRPLKKRFNILSKLLLDEKKNQKILGIAVYSTLGLVALVMTVMNILTDKGILTWSTGCFCGLCLLNLLLVLRCRHGIGIAKFFFSFEMLALFTFFLISGNPDGFSAIWICLLPAAGMLFFGRGRGSALCLAMLGILIFLLWVPYGNTLLQYDYTPTFMMRFPVLYISFYLLAFFLETVRQTALKEMTRLQKLYRELSIRDALTGVFNRHGLYSSIEGNQQFRDAAKLGAVMLDIDFFKSVNDTYGHEAGDVVLKGVSKLISESLDAVVCRWGGEEFVALYTDDHVTRDDLEQLRMLIEKSQFDYEGWHIHITASIGYFSSSEYAVRDVDRMVELADNALYTAKNTGRNRVVYYTGEAEASKPASY